MLKSIYENISREIANDSRVEREFYESSIVYSDSATLRIRYTSSVSGTCGNGVIENLEDCDDSNTVTEGCAYGQTSCTVCSSICRLAAGRTTYCGDSIYDGNNEQCDDGNILTGDGCSGLCRLENITLCGNSFLNPGEQCDDGNNFNGDGCSATCQMENLSACGNNQLDPAEQCDDGNLVNNDACSRFCQDEVCGDFIVQAGEGCDDGNTITENCTYGAASCSVCNDICMYENGLASFCGDMLVDYANAEQCEDGNLGDYDGCS